MLSGPNLSVPAALGAEFLLFADGLADGECRDREIRLALLARGRDPHVLFPEVFGAPEPEGDADDVAEDYADVDWGVPSGADEWSQIQAALAESSVSVRLSEGSIPDQNGWI